MRKLRGFTLIELLVVILILAILMAIALPLYLRAVRDSNRQTCRSNMQTIATALQAYRVRNASHWYPGVAANTAGAITLTAADFLGGEYDLSVLPQCPTETASGDNDDYEANTDADGQLTINCAAANPDSTYHNDVDGDLATAADQHGFMPGVDSR
ncbi:MAG: type IV pilin protein [Armatimonadota bacterium]